MNIAARLVFAAAVFGLGWWLAGPIGLAVAAPLAAMALTRVAQDAAAAFVRVIRQAAYRGTEGTHFAYRGTPLTVHEDVEGHRWLDTSDVRKIVRDLPRDATLGVIEPGHVEPWGKRGRMALRADALLNILQRALDPDAIRFKVWVEREVLIPSPAARRQRPGPKREQQLP